MKSPCCRFPGTVLGGSLMSSNTLWFDAEKHWGGGGGRGKNGKELESEPLPETLRG